MDSLFGISLNSIMVGLLLLMGLSFGALGWIAWRQALLVRMGIRNIRRRTSQTVLIVVGLMLSTLIICAAFTTGETVGYSATETIYSMLEEVDFVISFDPGEAAGRSDRSTELVLYHELRDAFAGDPEIDGITGALDRRLPVLNPSARLSEPDALVVGIEPETVDAFHGLRALDGEALSAARLGERDAYITDRLSRAIDAGVGSTITVYFDNAPAEFTVADVIRDSAITNQGDLEAGGMAVNIDTARRLFGDQTSVDNILVSVTGGVRDTLDASDAVEGRLQAFLDAHPEAGAEIAFTKKDTVAIADLLGSVFVSAFLVLGLFSMGAGVLLVFLIFVMLAAERRSEMGMARAVGMTRLHLTETYVAEGMAYNVGSALIGALLGVGVAWGLVFVLGRAIDGSTGGFDINFHLSAQGVVIAYATGVTITFATVALSAWRAANLNIVRAIRDLPEPSLLGGHEASFGNLGRASLGALWHVGWVAMLAFLAVVLFQGFVLSLVLYGLPLLVVIPLAMFFVTGARRARSGARGPAFWAWVVLLFPLALPSWGLIAAKPWADRQRNAGGWAVVMLIAGLLLTYLGGWQWGQAFAYTSGVALAVLAVTMLSVYWGARPQPALATGSLLLVWYWLLPLPFSLLWTGGEGWTDPVDGVMSRLGFGPKEIRSNIEMFFVSGVWITAAATIAVVSNARFLLALVTRSGRLLRGSAPAVQTAVAYPIAARLRTGMTLTMFGLVVFSLVVMAYTNYNFEQLFLGDEASAGFNVVVRGNPSNRIADLGDELVEAGYDLDGVSGIGTLVTARAQLAQDATADFEESFPLRGGDAAFFDLASLPLQTRASGYATDGAVLAAVQRDPRLVIASAELLRTGDTFRQPGGLFTIDRSATDLESAPWAPISLTARDPETGEMRELLLIGVLEPQVTGVLTDLVVLTTHLRDT